MESEHQRVAEQDVPVVAQRGRNVVARDQVDGPVRDAELRHRVDGEQQRHRDGGAQQAPGAEDRGGLLVPAPEALLAVARSSSQGLKLPAVATANGERTPQVVEGVIVTGDVFMADAAHQRILRDTLGATAVEMEGAAVVQACRQFGVSCLVVRSITDRADGQAEANYQQFITMASENAATLVAAIIAKLEDRAR